MIVKFLKMLLCISLLSSCSTVKNVSYFQDLESGRAIGGAEEREIKFMPNDKLSIIVSTKDPLLDGLFNLPIASRTISSAGSNTQNYVATYTVNPNGEIDFPVVGFIAVEGKNRFEVSQEIKRLLISRELVSDPVVTVEFSGLCVSVLGEVTRPGRYDIEHDKVTIIDALSQAGDLTIYGKRECVMVLREEGGKQLSYRVNMLDMESLYNSPVYYLQQNDVIYVEPNTVRARQSTVNGNNIRSTSFWMSLSSLLISIAYFIF